MDFLIAFITQMLASVGVIFIFGSIIALLRRSFCGIAGRSGPKILLITGIIGTPVHELSHALMCLLFGHKITDIKLYQPKSDDGALGYVSHTYNKRNVFHQIGNFFIGTAPILLGGGIIVLLMLLLVPNAFEVISLELDILSSSDIGSMPISNLFDFILTSIVEIFSADNLSSWQGWLFIVLSLMISSHMEMSGADIKNGLRGFAFVLVIVLALDALLYFISPDALDNMTAFTVSFGLLIAAILSISVIFLTAMLILALIFKAICSLFTR